MSYSHHFIKKVLKLKSEGMSFIKLSKKFDISVRSIQEWLKGNIPKGTRNKPNTRLDINKLKQDVIDYPDGYLQERATRLGVSEFCISYRSKLSKCLSTVLLLSKPNGALMNSLFICTPIFSSIEIHSLVDK